MSRILVIDDEPIMRDAVRDAMRRAGHEVEAFADGAEAMEHAAGKKFHLVISDLKMPGMDGEAVLERVKQISPDVPVILITAHGTVESAVAVMKKGAYDYIQKPFELEELELLAARALEHRNLAAENEALRARVRESNGVAYVWGAPTAHVHAELEKAAASDATVLITGESGVGKEVAARTLHLLSPRRDRPFLCVNCAALSAGLLESELFGHEKGAFTGADRMRKGRFELADEGTLLLDEVSEIDPNLQAKLLRVLQEKSFERVGSSLSRRADVRVIATTNRDLRAEVGKGRFREDLYYRLNVLPMRIPPLRERKEEIPDLAAHFLKRFGDRARISPAAMKRLQAYDWPGNVRELGNILERAVVLAPKEEVGAELISPWLEGRASGSEENLASWVGRPLSEVEDRLIDLALEHFDGNRERAARALGITSRTLRDRIKKRK